MSSGPRTPGPRHLAGGAHRTRTTHRFGTRPATPTLELEPTEVAPLARVKRSRLAFALSVTMAALPILVLDNLPASAARAETGDSESPLLTAADDRSSTSTSAAPTTTPAPPPSEAVAPTTTAAPTTTTTAAPAPKVVALRSSPPTTQAPAPPPPPPAPARRGDPNDPATWDQLAQCESGGNWSIDTGNGYYGGLQFSLATWQDYGGTGYPHHASKATQITIGKKLQAAKGWSAWPGCARRLGWT